MKLIKLTNHQKSQICGSGFNWIAIWGLSIITALVVKSFFAEKASVGITGIGRASWEKSTPTTSKPSTSQAKTDVTSIVKILKNIYEF